MEKIAVKNKSIFSPSPEPEEKGLQSERFSLRQNRKNTTINTDNFVRTGGEFSSFQENSYLHSMIKQSEDQINRLERKYNVLAMAQSISGLALVGIVLAGVFFSGYSGFSRSDAQLLGGIAGATTAVAIVVWKRMK